MLRAKLNFEELAMKRYLTLPRSPLLEPQNQIQFSAILGISLSRWYPLSLQWIQSEYSKTCQKSEIHTLEQLNIFWHNFTKIKNLFLRFNHSFLFKMLQNSFNYFFILKI